MNNPRSDTTQAVIASLYAKVDALEGDSKETKANIVAIQNSLQGISTKLAESKSTSWPTIFGGATVAVSFMVVFGGAIITPMQRDTSRLETTIVSLVDKGVFQREYAQEVLRINMALRDLDTKYGANVQQQRYNADQQRLTETLKQEKDSVEFLRNRSYDMQGRLSKLEKGEEDTNKRLDVISQRVIAIANRLGQIP